MRDLKFRAWNKEYSIMVFEDEDNSANYWDGVNCSDIEMVNSILKQKDGYLYMQYTGLKDKNGVEIYEGDIVTNQGGPCVVVYQAPSFVMKDKPHHKTWSTFTLAPTSNQFEEVLSNIHENPELLE